MCGFAGIAQLGGDGRGIDAALVGKLGDAIVHRGPDQGGTYFFRGALSVGLAARRLAILDLSAAGDQPMRTPDGALTLVYNGELYNEPSLRRELERRGYCFRSRSDTETVLYALQEEGPAALARLNGMFALALFDERRGRLLLARDRMGIKPLYYAWTPPAAAGAGGRLLFGSELRSLVTEAGLDRRVDAEALDLYLALGYVPAPHSLIAGVRKLEPGTYLELDAAGQLGIHRYWRPAYAPPLRLGQDSAAAAVRATLEGAVERQMRSDVPVGVLLSGGVDSTIVAACAAARTQQPVHTYSIRFTGGASAIAASYNTDADFARRVADDLGLEHHEVHCPDEGILPELLPDLALWLDEPVWELSFISIYLMSRQASTDGVRVLLTGDGSDELFGGYPWHGAAWRAQYYERLPLLKEALPFLRRVAPAGSTVGSHLANLARVHGLADAARYEWTHAIFRPEERAGLARAPEGSGSAALAAVVSTVLDGAGRLSMPERSALLDLMLWVRHHFNQRIDRMTMRNSVEARVPFQDNEVVDLALRLPFGAKSRWGRGKTLLKRAFRGRVPAYVLDRPKRPFAAPAQAWGTGALRSFTRETLAPQRLARTGLLRPEPVRRVIAAAEERPGHRSSSQLWTLVMLQQWAEALGVSGLSGLAGPELAEP